ncbi:hypothetical protein CCS41_06740 [Candidatus Fukatsuia symbiotica]|uniref:Uncharacterized protein n=1 Tax=Candidatus Fukatsuia symbiotica TaxID=1878942 RepID=A0A2U8I509_9GAMM|nr:hypothetical protein CCS41_06740 [Candidatus Fukatsuia symbiotica]
MINIRCKSLFEIFLSDTQTRKKREKKRNLLFVYNKRESMSILRAFLTNDLTKTRRAQEIPNRF